MLWPGAQATGGSEPTWDRQAGLTGTDSRGGCGSHQELAEAVGPQNSRVPRSTLGGAHSGASIQVRPGTRPHRHMDPTPSEEAAQVEGMGSLLC